MPAAERIARWMRQQLTATGARGFVVGLSGGIDSAVVARLAQLAAPGNVVAALLPCHSDPQDERDAALVAAQFSIPTVRIDVSTSYDALVADAQAAVHALPPQMRATSPPPGDPLARLPLANIKPRLRMTALYFLANSLNYFVAGTGNRAEIAIGYFSKHGDGGVDLLPIGRLLKSDVRALARELKMPSTIIERTPSAGLWVGQSDEEEMGFSYAELERYLEDGPQGVSPALAMCSNSSASGDRPILPRAMTCSCMEVSFYLRNASGRAAVAERPHPLKVVEGAHFGPEQMHHHVASIDQHPVGRGQAFDPDVAKPAMLDPFGQLLRHRRDLPGRTARGDHHVIGNRAFAFERDRDEFLRLIVVERLQDQGMQRAGLGFGQRESCA